MVNAMEKRMMTAATDVRTSCTQKASQPYRRQALAAVMRFCRAASEIVSSSGTTGGSASDADAAIIVDG